MSLFPSTILPQTNDPKEIQKGMLDLLDKINQVGGAGGAAVEIRGVTTHQIGTGGGTFLVTTGSNDVAIYLPKVRGSAAVEIYKVDAGSGRVVVYPAAQSSETIDGVASVTLYSQYNKLAMIPASTFWAIRDCKIAGSNANGSFRYEADGTLVQWGACTGRSFSINNALVGGFRSTGGSAAAGLIDLPVPFIDTSYVYTPVPKGPNAISAVSNTTGMTTQLVDTLLTAVTSQGVAAREWVWTAIGRWK